MGQNDIFSLKTTKKEKGTISYPPFVFSPLSLFCRRLLIETPGPESWLPISPMTFRWHRDFFSWMSNPSKRSEKE